MKVKVGPNFKVRQVLAPASKSYAQRALFAAALCDQNTVLLNLGSSNDVLHITEIIQQLGAKVSFSKNKASVSPRINPPKKELNCGESGLGIRLTTSIASTFGAEFSITGSGSLTKRPMHEFVSFLPNLGVNFSSNEGFVPLQITNRLKGGMARIDGSISSQYLSGLLMALPLAKEDSVLEVKDLKSVPYVEMTLALLKDFKIEIENEDFKRFSIKSGQKYCSPKTYQIEGDWSGAAFWIVYGAIANPIAIQGLNKNSLQADRAIMDVLDQVGANYSWNNGVLQIQPSPLKPFEFDANDCPDLFPILTTLAASISGSSKIHGVNRLTYKESNRALAIKKEFSKLGLSIEIEEDTMHITGTTKLKSTNVHSHNDHRMAMSLAIASCLTPDGVEINEAESVAKSYPEFWNIIENQGN